MVAAHLPFNFGRNQRLICTGNEMFLPLDLMRLVRYSPSSSLLHFIV